MVEVNGYLVLERFVQKHPNRKTAAKALGISPSYLTDLLHQRRDLSAKMLGKLGLKRTLVQK